ncbi:hypothetical protein RJ639_044034 [Escallonia herrerae]|uniref:Uncharacterized protein n=1 Tax=Escallonia herrerae TaxID=1293975 RepID=A0AA88WC32_9ASTE|nr:hypothetical protein RJ639_044034 [Escallonia herrerae]
MKSMIGMVLNWDSAELEISSSFTWSWINMRGIFFIPASTSPLTPDFESSKAFSSLLRSSSGLIPGIRVVMTKGSKHISTGHVFQVIGVEPKCLEEQLEEHSANVMKKAQVCGGTVEQDLLLDQSMH